ncbi:MAG: hypothetical protein KDC44_03660 [Phaeodactylibacter sp.]|nr:hypothetical protein [Phaeodactylibacter sp.]
MQYLTTRSIGLFLTAALCLGAMPVKAQILKRQLERAGEKFVEKVIDKELKEDGDDPLFEREENTSTDRSDDEDYQVRVKGKDLAPPDAGSHISNAQSALSASNFTGSRSEIRQAIMAVEVAMGQELLKSLPETVNGMNYLPDEDEVASTGIGFVGLVIRREYKDNGRRMSVAIVNNHTLMAQYNLYLSNSAYAEGDDQYKTVTVQGQEGVITFDGGNEYDLGVPLGQNTVFTLECINFNDESQVMSSANTFDMKDIMKKLGDQ